MNTKLRAFTTLAGAYLAVLSLTGSHCNEVTGSGTPAVRTAVIPTQTPTPLPAPVTPLSGPPVIASITHGGFGVHHGTKVDFRGIGFGTSSTYFLPRNGASPVILIHPFSKFPGVIEVEVPSTAPTGYYGKGCVTATFGSDCKSFAWYLSAP